MSSSHRWWSSTESTDRPISFTFRRSNSGLSFATEPSSVVHIGVKSLGCENNTAHESPIHSWNRIVPSVVCASKSGAMSPSRRLIVLFLHVIGFPCSLVVQGAEVLPLRLDGPTRAGRERGPFGPRFDRLGAVVSFAGGPRTAPGP